MLTMIRQCLNRVVGDSNLSEAETREVMNEI